ncbi:MAG TPA: hypothetical protein DCX89_00835 [Saprospirales bacterium]|nr:hypothetical protein [Saprospirales bacterium]HAY70410.1 hypothetical protein [Saprospirales bacterium]HRQ28934.1 hypothetical protein [Saprospiraceae bacterium]
MYNRYFKKITALLLSLNLILASVGIPVYKHYCQDKLIGFQYIIAEDNFCHLEHTDSAVACSVTKVNIQNNACCSDHEEKTCCAEKDDDVCCSDGQDCKNCCRNEMELVKIDLIPIFQTEKIINYNLTDFDFDTVHPFHTSILLHEELPCSHIVKQSRSGPLPDGQSRVISFQKFIC